MLLPTQSRHIGLTERRIPHFIDDAGAELAPQELQVLRDAVALVEADCLPCHRIEEGPKRRAEAALVAVGWSMRPRRPQREGPATDFRGTSGHSSFVIGKRLPCGVNGIPSRSIAHSPIARCGRTDVVNGGWR